MAFQSDAFPTQPPYQSNAAYLTRLDKLLKKGRPHEPGYLIKRWIRYGLVFSLWSAGVWVPITGYLTSTPPSYTSHMSLILPGSGASSSVNIDSIGQASSHASSAFANNSVSPTQTYKRLIRADRILDAAAATLGTDPKALPRPKVTLVDQTGLIHVEITGGSADEARDRNQAVLDAFFSEVEALRTDDLNVREQGAVRAIEEYRNSVLANRNAVSTLQNETGFLSRDQFAAQVAVNDERQASSFTLKAKLDEKTAYVASLEARLGLSAEHAARALDLYSDQEYLALVADVADKAAGLAEARARYGSNHPRRREAEQAYIQSQEATLRAAMSITALPRAIAARLNVSQFGDRTQLLAELLRAEADRSGLSAQYNTLSQSVATEKSRLERASRAAAQLEDLQRDFQVAEAVFASAIARAQSSKTDVFASYPLVQVLENPSLPDGPSSPRRKLAIVAGAGATMLILMALTLGWVRRGLIRWLIGQRKDED